MLGRSQGVRNAFTTFRNETNSFLDKINKLDFKDKLVVENLKKLPLFTLLMGNLEFPDDGIRTKAAKILIRLMRSSKENVIVFVSNGFLPVLLHHIENSASISFRTYVAGIYGEICRFNLRNTYKCFHEKSANVIFQFVKHPNEHFRESIEWVVAYMCRHSRRIANVVADSGMIRIFMTQVLKDSLRVNISAMLVVCDLAQQSERISKICVKTSCIPIITKSLELNANIRFKTLGLQTLAVLCSYRGQWANMVMNSGSAKYALAALLDDDMYSQAAASTYIAQIMKYSSEKILYFVNHSCINGCYTFIEKVKSPLCKSAIFCIGYACSLSGVCAMNLIEEQNGTKKPCIPVLQSLLHCLKDDECLQAVLWMLTSIGKHSAKHAEHVCKETNLLQKCIKLHARHRSSYALRRQSLSTLLQLMDKLEYAPAIFKLLEKISIRYLTLLLPRFLQLFISEKDDIRVAFYSSGALEKMQKIECVPGSKLHNTIRQINFCYPPDIIKYLNPEFDDVLMKQVTEFRQWKPMDCALLRYIRRQRIQAILRDIRRRQREEDEKRILVLLAPKFSNYSHSSVPASLKEYGYEYEEEDLHSDQSVGPSKASSVNTTSTSTGTAASERSDDFTFKSRSSTATTAYTISTVSSHTSRSVTFRA